MSSVIRNFKLKILVKYQIYFHMNRRSQLKLVTTFLQGEHLGNVHKESNRVIDILVLSMLST